MSHDRTLRHPPVHRTTGKGQPPRTSERNLAITAKAGVGGALILQNAVSNKYNPLTPLGKKPLVHTVAQNSAILPPDLILESLIHVSAVCVLGSTSLRCGAPCSLSTIPYGDSDARSEGRGSYNSFLSKGPHNTLQTTPETSCKIGLKKSSMYTHCTSPR